MSNTAETSDSAARAGTVGEAGTVVEPTTASKSSGIRFSARDLINVAIFSVIYFVVIYAVAMLGILGPVVMLVTLPLAVIVAGIPYMLFLTKVKHFGMVTLFGTIIALLYLMSGQPWQSTVLTIVLSIAADLLLAASKYRSKWAAIGAYTVFTMWFIGPWIPFFMNAEEYIDSQGMAAMGEDYVAAFTQVVTVPAVLISLAAVFVCGILGGLLGSAMLRKHFVKAGLA